ncbi:MAG: Rne/Rng family ribonuclease [Prochlorothrix sp.]
MPKQIIIAEQHRVAAVFAEDQIEELIVAQGTHQIGDIYLGLVENVLPGIDAAFVNIGDSDRNGFIHVSDLGPLRLRSRSGAITELLEPKQKVLVQVMKEPTGNKGPRLTGNITLPGRYLVLMPFRRGVNLSRRINSESERSRLRALAILVKPAGMGLLVRTEAEGIAEEAIIEDLEFLQRQWETIQQENDITRAPALLNRDDDFVQRVLRDMYTADVNRIVVDSVAGLKRVKQHLMNWGSGRIPLGLLIDQHRERASILEYFRVNAAIREAVKPRVDLPSGGYIIIEPTEALTVIDVNSGSFTRSATSRETVLWTNFEAATEIARQLRLRNVAGVIVVDFIDMDSRRDQLQVLKHFEDALKADKARPQIAQLSELGLVELTRKRQGQNIYESFGRPCPTCGGLGHVIHLPGEPDPLLNPPALELESRSRAAVADATPRWSPSSSPRSTPALPSSPDSGKSSWPERRTLEEDSPEASVESSPGGSSYYGSDSRGSTLEAHNSRRRRRNPDLAESDSGSSYRSSTYGTSPEPLPATPSPTPSAEGRRSRSDYGAEGSSRFGSRRGRVVGKPPEVITVQMNESEQEVYSWMGISPLVLSEQPVENPRNTVVKIQTPEEAAGSAPSTPALPSPATPSETANPGAIEGSPTPTLSPTVAAAMVAGAWGTEPAKPGLEGDRGPSDPDRDSFSSRPSKAPIPKITATITPTLGTLSTPALPTPTLSTPAPALNPVPALDPTTPPPSLAPVEPPVAESQAKPKPQVENRRRRRRSSATHGEDL